MEGTVLGRREEGHGPAMLAQKPKNVSKHKDLALVGTRETCVDSSVGLLWRVWVHHVAGIYWLFVRDYCRPC